MKVAIVGMGVAGLRAANLLQEQGIRPLLFEARERLGGRVRTLKDGGAVFEAGAEWLDADHARCLDLLRGFGIDTRSAESWPRRVWFRGESCSTDDLWPEAMDDEVRFTNEVRRLGQGLSRVDHENGERSDLDRRTLGKFLDEVAESPRGRFWLESMLRSDEGEDTHHIGLLPWLCAYLPYLEREEGAVSHYRVEGGLGRLVDAMAASLDSRVHLGTVLQRVVNDTKYAILQFEDFEVEVDRVILTLPPPLLEKVVFDLPLSCNKRCAIEGAQMSRAIKVVMEFDRAFWKDLGWNGSLHADTVLQQVWDATLGDNPCLCAYVCGEAAHLVTNRADSVLDMVGELEKLFPGAQKHFVRGWTFDWVSEPFSHGAFSHFPPGYALTYRKYLAAPELRVHFAGEHTALWNGFVEGALESAERVVKEVLDA